MTFRIAAGIKAHSEWKGNRETGLTRAKVIESGAEFTAPVKLKDAPIKVRNEMRVSDLTIDQNGVYFLNGAYYKVRETKGTAYRSEEHTSELQSLRHLVC